MEAIEPSIQPDGAGYRIRIQVPGLTIRSSAGADGQYLALDIPGWSRVVTPGEPAVPRKTIMLEIPPGLNPVVACAVGAAVPLANLDIAPAQPPPPDVRPDPPAAPFQKNAGIYASDDLYPPGNLIGWSVAQVRNRRILEIEVAPIQARPLSREAVAATDLELTVAFEKRPSGSPEIGRAPDAPDPVERLPEGFTNGAPAQYMILMDDQFTNNAVLAEFVEWKRRKGYQVTIVTTSQIDPAGAPTNGQIVSYLRGLPAASYPEYLLIIGDHTPANGVEGYYFITSDGGWSDLPIACRTSTDHYPDLYYGRIPATNNMRLSVMLQGVLDMDRNPPTNGMHQKVCVAGMIQDSDDGNNVADRLFCETADLVACYFEQDAGGVDYICERAIVNPSAVTTNCLWNPGSILWNSSDRIGYRVWQHFIPAATASDRISQNINRGLALLQHRDHGYSGGYGWADPDYQSARVRSLTNGCRRPAVFSINCASGAYQHDRFLRAWLQNTNGGAYAVFAPVDISYSWYNDWLTHGFYTAFLSNYVSFQNNSTEPNWPKNLPAPGGSYGAAGTARRLGQILNFGKLYLREKYSDDLTTFRLFHLFGDPESYIQLITPATPAITHPAAVNLGVTTRVVISNLLSDSQVCLYSSALGIQQVTNAAGASVSLDVTPMTTGTLWVTVTRYATRPYSAPITVQGNIIALDAAQYEVSENTGVVWVAVNRTGNTNLAVSVAFATLAGTATAGADYLPTNGTLTFAAGQTAAAIAIPILQDYADEDFETLTLVLSNPSPDTIVGAFSNAVIRIEDDDGAGQLGFAAGAFTVSEAAAAATITVRRCNGVAGAISVNYATADGTATADADYITASGTLNFAEGEVRCAFVVPLLGDPQDESDETVALLLRNPVGGATLQAPSNATLTILDDDHGGTLALGAAGYVTSESAGSLRIWVIRSGGSDGTATVEYFTSNGTAVAGADYTAAAGMLSLGPGVLSNSFDIAIADDADGTTNETFSVRLRNASGAALAAPTSAVVTVLDGLLMLSEDFESGILPLGWTQIYVTNATAWMFQSGGYTGGAYPAAAHGGIYNACLYYGDYNPQVTRLVTPAMNLTGRANPELTFWHCQALWGPDQDELRVYYRTNITAAWVQLANYTTNVAAWTQRVMSLPNPSASYYLAFEGIAKYGYGVCVDDVQVTAGVAGAPAYTFSATCSPFGSVTPMATSAAAGASVAFTLTPSNFYHLSAVYTNGGAVARIFSNHTYAWTFVWSNVASTGSIAAVFAPNTATHNVPHVWLIQCGWTSQFDQAALSIGSNGCPVWHSYIAGLDPWNPTSQFTCTAPDDPAALSLRFNTITGRLYRVEYATNLLGATWPVLSNNIPGTGSPVAIPDPNPPGAARYYRVGVRLAP